MRYFLSPSSAHPLQLVNPRGQRLEWSQYLPTPHPTRLPALIYCHGNAGSRLDSSSSSDVAALVLPLGISLVALDFSGSGRSEGDYVSLGHYEQQDLAALVAELRQRGTTIRIGLWGTLPLHPCSPKLVRAVHGGLDRPHARRPGPLHGLPRLGLPLLLAQAAQRGARSTGRVCPLPAQDAARCRLQGGPQERGKKGGI